MITTSDERVRIYIRTSSKTASPHRLFAYSECGSPRCAAWCERARHGVLVSVARRGEEDRRGMWVAARLSGRQRIKRCIQDCWLQASANVPQKNNKQEGFLCSSVYHRVRCHRLPNVRVALSSTHRAARIATLFRGADQTQTQHPPAAAGFTRIQLQCARLGVLDCGRSRALASIARAFPGPAGVPAASRHQRVRCQGARRPSRVLRAGGARFDTPQPAQASVTRGQQTRGPRG